MLEAVSPSDINLGRKVLRKKASVEVFYHSYRYSFHLRFLTSLSLGESLYSRKLPTHGCGTRRLTQESRSDLFRIKATHLVLGKATIACVMLRRKDSFLVEKNETGAKVRPYS